MENLNGVTVFGGIMNFVTFIIYGLDKLLAKMHSWRVPENFLLLLAITGGSVGAYFAMQIFRHKTLHLKFRLGVPLIFLVQIVAWIYFKL